MKPSRALDVAEHVAQVTLGSAIDVTVILLLVASALYLPRVLIGFDGVAPASLSVSSAQLGLCAKDLKGHLRTCETFLALSFAE
jgi:hypothetical protein